METIANSTLSLRAVKTLDLMSAEPYKFDFVLLRMIRTRIVNEVD